jgi:hypothetical protein
VNVAKILGYKNIILCGVDLNSQYHFYDYIDEFDSLSKNEQLELSKEKSNICVNWNPENIHSSACRRKAGDLSILSILKWINDTSDLNIYCSNKNSKLIKENTLEYRGIMND